MELDIKKYVVLFLLLNCLSIWGDRSTGSLSSSRSLNYVE